MSAHVKTTQVRLEIFKNFIKNCIDKFDADPSNIITSKTFQIEIFNDVINNHKKLLKNIINSISSKDTSFDDLEHIQDFVREYFKNETKWNSFYFKKTFNAFKEFLNNDIKYIYYFTPIYNLKGNFNEFDIDEITKIRKIRDYEKKWLEQKYENYTPVKTNIYDLEYILIIKIEKNSQNPTSEAKKKIRDIVDLLRIYKKGDLRTGGMYYFDKSEKWNPQNKIKRITYEPIVIHSENIYLIKTQEKNKIIQFFGNSSKCFPDVKNRDYFDRSIRRFGSAMEKDNTTEKILDIVISLESLIGPGSNDSTLKLSQRVAILICKNDADIIEQFEFIKTCYNFRSGIVHESMAREIKLKNIGVLTDDKVVSKLEFCCREVIKRMIHFSELPNNKTLSHEKLAEKIDELLLNRKLWIKYKRSL